MTNEEKVKQIKNESIDKVVESKDKNTNIMIVGSRGFSNYDYVEQKVDQYIKDNRIEEPITIISGGARGVDTLAEKYADEKKYKFKCFPANWGQFGSAAGPIRNKKMVRYIEKHGGVCLVFWDGKSTGSKEDIELCGKFHVKCIVFRVKKNEKATKEKIEK